MNPHTRVANALTRIATSTSVRRTRAEDTARVQRHGSPNGDRQKSEAQRAQNLETVARHLESHLS